MTEKTTIVPLTYAADALAPVMSAATVDYHYEHLAKAYAERLAAGVGEYSFNEAGVVLHNLFFEQLQAPQADNKPFDASLAAITQSWQTFDIFQAEIERIASTVQGSGWIAVDKECGIVNFSNHAYVTGFEQPEQIMLLIDLWEHAWALDYQADKKRYLSNIWKIIDWRYINGVLGQSN
jgi:Fe-Mn family superoxide dismutase